MSLIPFVIGFERPHRYMQQQNRPTRVIDQDFGLSLTPDDILSAVAPAVHTGDYYRPWRQVGSLNRDLGSTVKTDKDNFQINLDVQHFSPDELSVKTVDGFVVIEGKHEEKKDSHGFISRHFVRKYMLPEGACPEDVESRLSSDGVLLVSAPRKMPEAVKGEKTVSITKTGPVRKEPKQVKPEQSNVPVENK